MQTLQQLHHSITTILLNIGILLRITSATFHIANRPQKRREVSRPVSAFIKAGVGNLFRTADRFQPSNIFRTSPQ